MPARALPFCFFALAVLISAERAGALNLTAPHGRHVPPTGPWQAVPEGSEPVTACDRLAADPQDDQRVSAGVPSEALDAAPAVSACQLAVTSLPTKGRLFYQLGRSQQKLGSGGAALASFHKSADLGSLIGAFSAGVMERDGSAGDPDDAEANRLFTLCADKGDADCQNALGYQYQTGRGTTQDLARALALYRQAAESGLSDANVNLGFLYRDGEGVQRDYAEAARRFQLAADKGDPNGTRNLAVLYQDGLGVPKDEARAFALFQEAADQGDEDALVKIAVAYLTGKGVSKDVAKSFSYYQQAADKGNTDGMAGLAYAYANGQGVAADGRMAAYWMVRALAAGNDYAFDQLTNHWGAWSRDMRMGVQAIFEDRGLYSGKVNGALNRELLKAIRVLAGR